MRLVAASDPHTSKVFATVRLVLVFLVPILLTAKFAIEKREIDKLNEALSTCANTFAFQSNIKACTIVISATRYVKRDHRGAAYYNRGTSYFIQSKPKLALKDLNKALKFDPHDYKIYANRSLAHEQLGDYNSALKDIDMAIQYNPENKRFEVQRRVIMQKIEN